MISRTCLLWFVLLFAFTFAFGLSSAAMVEQEPGAAKNADEAPMEEHHEEICKDDQDELDTNDDGVVSTDEVEQHHQTFR